MKKHKFTELSSTACSNPTCGTLLKKNVVERSLIPRVCWKCWVMFTRKMTLTAYKKYRTLRRKIRAEGGDVKAAHTTTF